MKDYRDLFTIYSFDLSAQPFITNGNQLSVKIERRAVAADNRIFNNPRNLVAYIILLNSQNISSNHKKQEIRKY